MKTAADLMTKEVITVAPEMAIKDFAQLLTDKDISGAPVVDKAGKLVGVVTENDLVDQNKAVHIPTVISIFDAFVSLESWGRTAKEMQKVVGSTVGDIATKKVHTVLPNATLEEIATIMSEDKIHTLPVIDDDKLVGIIGKRDIIRAIIS